jgi:glycosyltransferase involved in cell wall biosynthesis
VGLTRSSLMKEARFTMSLTARVTIVVLGETGADMQATAAALAGQADLREDFEIRWALGGATEFNAALSHVETEFVSFVDVRDHIGPHYVSRVLQRASRYTITLACRAELTFPAGWIDPKAAKPKAQTYSLDKVVPSLLSLAGVTLPRQWLAGVQMRSDVGRWADAVFMAQCLAGYVRAGVILDATPGLVADTYTRTHQRGPTLVPDASPGSSDLSHSNADSTKETAIAEVISAVEALTDSFGHPDDAPVFAQLLQQRLKTVASETLRGEQGLVAAYAEELSSLNNPEFTVEGLLGRWSFQGPSQWTLYRLHQRPVVLVMTSVHKYKASAWIVDGLVQLGAKVQVLYVHGHLNPEDLNPDVDYRRMNHVGVVRGSGLKRKVSRVMRRVRGLRQKLARDDHRRTLLARDVMRHDSHVAWVARHAFVRLALDAGGFEVMKAMQSLSGRDIEDITKCEPRRYLLLAASLHPGDADALMPAIPKATRELADRGVLEPLDLDAFVAVLAKFLQGAKHHESRVMVDAAAAMYSANPNALLIDIWQRALQVRANMNAEDPSSALIERALRLADESQVAFDYARALWLMEAVCQIVFAASVNTANEESPLFKDPTAHLALLRTSRLWQMLSTPVSAAPPPRIPSGAQGTRVVVSRGPYPRFTAPVIEVLDRTADVVQLKNTGVYREQKYLDVDVHTLRRRLRAALGDRADWDPSLMVQIQRADVLFCDWADKAAVMASVVAPAKTRLVIRMHGADAISTWLHLVDWARVDVIIFVSHHLKSLVQDVLGERLRDVRMHVIPNVIDTQRFSLPKLPAARRTLGLVGWGQKVKDAVFALEVLSKLREDDPNWRLQLFGNDFPAKRADESEYAREFRHRAGQDDVREAIEYMGYVESLPAAFQSVGYGLSTSLRESFPVGLLEMAASGAIPVVRSWPMYGARGEIADSLPTEWFVDSVDDAVKKIRAADAAFEDESAGTLMAVSQRYGRGVVEDAYARVVLGSNAAMEQSACSAADCESRPVL